MLKKQKIMNELLKLRPYFKTTAIFICALIVSGIALHYFSKPNAKIIQAHRQIVSLAEQIRSYYRSKPDAWGLNTASAIKNNLVGKEMINGRILQNALGKEVLLGADSLGNTVMPGNKNAVIVYKNLNKKECEELAALPFDEKMQLSLNSITIVNEQEHIFIWGGENPLPLSKDKANKICKNANDILWDIYL